VEVGQAHAFGGDGVDVRCLDVGAVAAQLGEPDVVEHDEHHVRRVLGRRGLRWPPRLRVAPVVADRSLEVHLCHGPRSRLSGVPRARRPGPLIETDLNEFLEHYRHRYR